MSAPSYRPRVPVVYEVYTCFEEHHIRSQNDDGEWEPLRELRLEFHPGELVAVGVYAGDVTRAIVGATLHHASVCPECYEAEERRRLSERVAPTSWWETVDSGPAPKDWKAWTPPVEPKVTSTPSARLVAAARAMYDLLCQFVAEYEDVARGSPAVDATRALLASLTKEPGA